jgi:hypothetical protein
LRSTSSKCSGFTTVWPNSVSPTRISASAAGSGPTKIPSSWSSVVAMNAMPPPSARRGFVKVAKPPLESRTTSSVVPSLVKIPARTAPPGVIS